LFQHTGHIGIDGIHFGNVAGFFDFKSTSYASMPCLAGAGIDLINLRFGRTFFDPIFIPKFWDKFYLKTEDRNFPQYILRAISLDLMAF
jgi:hypothetical protein